MLASTMSSIVTMCGCPSRIHGICLRFIGKRGGQRCQRGNYGYLELRFSPWGWTLEHLDLIPRITEAAPRIATALQTAENWGVEARIPGLCGIPICILPGYEEFFDEFYDESPALIQTRDYVAACDTCHHKGQCSGYWNKYYELYGKRNSD